MVKPRHKPGVGCGHGSEPGTFSTKVEKIVMCQRESKKHEALADVLNYWISCKFAG